MRLYNKDILGMVFEHENNDRFYYYVYEIDNNTLYIKNINKRTFKIYCIMTMKRHIFKARLEDKVITPVNNKFLRLVL